jgi:hypothetical protein
MQAVQARDHAVDGERDEDDRDQPERRAPVNDAESGEEENYD